MPHRSRRSCGIERIGLELRVLPHHHRHRVGRDDGGYYLLGLREKMPFLFEETPWGTDQVFALMQRRAERGIAPAVLERLADLDRPEDLARWPKPVE